MFSKESVSLVLAPCFKISLSTKTSIKADAQQVESEYNTPDVHYKLIYSIKIDLNNNNTKKQFIDILEGHTTKLLNREQAGDEFNNPKHNPKHNNNKVIFIFYIKILIKFLIYNVDVIFFQVINIRYNI